jgi:hypothetical protein
MYTAAKIRRQIFHHTDDKPFSVRPFFKYGSRPAVYQVFCRLVKTGIIIRVAHGLFIKADAPMPSPQEAAQAKAAAFHKTIATHGANAAYAFELTKQSPDEQIFAVSGASSSFRFGDKVIRLIGTCARKMHLGDDLVGLAIRALWHIGQNACDMNAIEKALKPFRRPHKEKLREHKDLMPHWMQECFDYLERPSTYVWAEILD